MSLNLSVYDVINGGLLLMIPGQQRSWRGSTTVIRSLASPGNYRHILDETPRRTSETAPSKLTGRSRWVHHYMNFMIEYPVLIKIFSNRISH